MERLLLNPEISISRLIYGFWRLTDDSDLSPRHVEAKISAALDQGVSTFDQADIYGGYTAERALGGALKANPSLRSRMEIITKCGIVVNAGRHAGVVVKHYNTTKQHIHNSVNASLSEMGIEYIDVLLIHRPDPFMDHYQTASALDELVDAGKVRAVGVSNFKPWDWQLLQSAMRHTLVTNQIELSLRSTSALTNGDLAFHQQHDHVVMAWSPLAGGKLMNAQGVLGERLDGLANRFKVDRAAVALAFLLAHPARIAPIVGTNNLARIAKVADACKVALDRQDWFGLYEGSLGEEVP